MSVNKLDIFAQLGISTTEMIERIKVISDLISRMEWAEAEITAVKDSLNDLCYRVDEQDEIIECRIDALDAKACEFHANAMAYIDELRPATNAQTVNPNQKSDLEIFNRIIPSEDFLKLEDNMFLN